MNDTIDWTSVNVVLTNKLGLHARAIIKFVDKANLYQSCMIRVACEGRQRDGKSVAGLWELLASCGKVITIKASGEQATQATSALRELIEGRFGETAVAVEFLEEGCIKLPLVGTNRKEVIQELLELIRLKHGVTRTDRLLSDAEDREVREPTGSALGRGIAAPHATDPQCPGLYIALGNLKTPIDWRARDGQLVQTVFLTVGPDRSYQRALIDMSRVFESEEVRKRVRSATDAKEVYSVINRESERLTKVIDEQNAQQ